MISRSVDFLIRAPLKSFDLSFIFNRQLSNAAVAAAVGEPTKVAHQDYTDQGFGYHHDKVVLAVSFHIFGERIWHGILLRSWFVGFIQKRAVLLWWIDI